MVAEVSLRSLDGRLVDAVSEEWMVSDHASHLRLFTVLKFYIENYTFCYIKAR